MSGPRLYLVTPPLAQADAFLPKLEAALDAAPLTCLRLRMAPGAPEDQARRAADAVRAAAHARDVAVTLTDDYRLVRPHGLDGVHLENPRLSVREARKALGADAIIGAFAGASRHHGMTAGEAGADYVALGPLVDDGRGDGALAEDELFQWWSEMIETPVVAEGGVDESAIGRLEPIVDFFAVDDAVWSAEDPAAALTRLAALLS